MKMQQGEIKILGNRR